MWPRERQVAAALMVYLEGLASEQDSPSGECRRMIQHQLLTEPWALTERKVMKV